MMQNYKVQNMQADDIEIACQWAKKEGWGPGIDDPMTFYQADPNGFFKGVVEDKIVSVGSMVCYDSNFAFSGLYIVHPNFRGQGFGLALTHKRLEYAGSRLIGLDGVVENVSMYQKIGYKPYLILLAMWVVLPIFDLVVFPATLYRHVETFSPPFKL